MGKKIMSGDTIAFGNITNDLHHGLCSVLAPTGLW